ncbi:MAG TPA: HDOD domain-containing protein, partial [Desulfohalobiaceae bacterium]|nr:HDOD domain-containing protein [Desulfohalobiaceae bacterium]
VWIKDEDEDHIQEIQPEIPKEVYDQAESYLKEKFRLNNLDDPFVQELFRVSLIHKAQELQAPKTDDNSAQNQSTEADKKGFKRYRKKTKEITVNNLVNDRLRLGTLPDIYYRVIEAIHDPNRSIADISDIVGKDPALSAKVLQLVNSSFYSLLQEVDTLTRSLALIGTNQLMTIVTGVSVVSIFKNISSRLLNMRLFWEHSVACGIVARLLANYLPGVVNSERYFVAGLLHDLGRLIMVQTIPEEYSVIFDQSDKQNQNLSQLEEHKFGFDHAQVGAFLAEKWNLPLSLEKMIRYHHQPAEQSQNLDPMIVYMANLIVTGLDIGSSGEFYVPVLQTGIWEQLQLSQSILEPLVVQLDHQLKDTMNLIYG